MQRAARSNRLHLANGSTGERCRKGLSCKSKWGLRKAVLRDFEIGELSRMRLRCLLERLESGQEQTSP
jgi:hypothetical protein